MSGEGKHSELRGAGIARSVYLRKNVPDSSSITMSLPSGRTTFAKFLRQASKRLGFKVTRLFLATGAEISDLEEIESGDILYASGGEPFHLSASASGLEELHIAVLGIGAVGKSALTLRFVRNMLVTDWDPTIEDEYAKTVPVDGRTAKLRILDTAGQDDFDCLRTQWMMGKDAYIFVYSLVDSESLERLKAFYDLYKQINPAGGVPIVLAANKLDLVHEDPGARRVSEAEGRAAAAQYGATYIETSAHADTNATQLFETAVRKVRGTPPKAAAPPPSGCCGSCIIL